MFITVFSLNTVNNARKSYTLIKDLKDFTATFFQKHTLINVLLKYSVFDASHTLLVMRPYQIAATERILWKIQSAYEAKNWSNTESGGYIWHTTGSGKTLTSFKAAQLATLYPFIDKVLFVVDRKDLDYQTMKEYQKFSPDSVNGSNSTAGLKANLSNDDNKIIVTTIQKLNNLMRAETDLPIYTKQVVFIFDECHRSQFGEAQKNLKRKFKKYYQFGFTGTPIFPDNALGDETTASVFGRELHSYVITDAIRDDKVLKFKVDYNDVRPEFKHFESEVDEKKLSAAETKLAFLHPTRIAEITNYILDNFRHKTHRAYLGGSGFNAMFAVSSVDAAKAYYEAFKTIQQAKVEAGLMSAPLNVATIFSYAANEEQQAQGDIVDESLDVTAMNSTAKEFLTQVVNDYNAQFKTTWSLDGQNFNEYYKDISKRVKGVGDNKKPLPQHERIDLLIVVGMFLTGFDAPALNTLFVDKNLRYHGLIQAFSRTNRIYDATKSFGNIVTFRNLEQATIDAITLFGNKNTRSVVLEKNYDEYLKGFTDILTGQTKRGFVDIVSELEAKFPDASTIETEKDKKAFVKLFGEYLRVENILKNYDEFTHLQAFQSVNVDDEAAVAAFKKKYYLTDEDIVKLQATPLPSQRAIQDYRSSYNDIRDWLRKEKANDEKDESILDWDDVVFEVELLKSQEINLDYILALIFEHNKHKKDSNALIEEVTRLVRSSLGNRAKESLLVDFIKQTDLSKLEDKESVIAAFFEFARQALTVEVDSLIEQEQLNPDATKRYIAMSLKREYASDKGTELNSILPKLSPLNPQYKTKKQQVFDKISEIVEKFKGVGMA